ncbi:DUF6069 family protein [Streptacidiphilus sp. PAMC 29251]
MPNPILQGSADAATSDAVEKRRPLAATVGLLLAAVVVASLVNTAIAAIARAAGASSDFKPLQASAFVAFTLFGILIGAAGWALVRRRAQDPQALLRRLVPTVLVISFVPDLAMLVSDYSPHSSTAGVIGLLFMHVAVAAIAVTTYRRVLPVADTRR